MPSGHVPRDCRLQFSPVDGSDAGGNGHSRPIAAGIGTAGLVYAVKPVKQEIQLAFFMGCAVDVSDFNAGIVWDRANGLETGNVAAARAMC